MKFVGRLVSDTDPEGFLTEGINSKESVLSTWIQKFNQMSQTTIFTQVALQHSHLY